MKSVNVTSVSAKKGMVTVTEYEAKRALIVANLKDLEGDLEDLNRLIHVYELFGDDMLFIMHGSNLVNALDKVGRLRSEYLNDSFMKWLRFERAHLKVKTCNIREQLYWMDKERGEQ